MISDFWIFTFIFLFFNFFPCSAFHLLKHFASIDFLRLLLLLLLIFLLSYLFFLFFIILVSQNLLSFFENYLALSGSIGVARIFDWGGGGPKLQITCNDVIRNFETGIFCGSKDIVEWKIKSRSLVLTRN